MIRDFEIVTSIGIAVGGLIMLLPGEKPVPPERRPAIQATIEKQAGCVTIECQVCPADGYFSTRDKEFCNALGWSYYWTPEGWAPDDPPEAFYARNPTGSSSRVFDRFDKRARAD